MTVLDYIQRSTEFLTRKGVESPRLQAELMLAHVLGMPRLKLYLNFERELKDSEVEVLREMVKRRSQREPLQHIIGSVNFCGLELAVNRDVLVPRPETELLAERAWQLLTGMPRGGRVLDFGTGSGCLAVTLAVKCPEARVWALDVSEKALEVARENAKRHGAAERIEFLQGDGFGALAGRKLEFDLLVSNPPYIPTATIAGLEPEVRDFDPRLALDGGADGLEVIWRLASEGLNWLVPGGHLLMEFGDGQEEAVQEIFRGSGWEVGEVLKDLTGRPRILAAAKTKGECPMSKHQLRSKSQ